MAKRASPSRVWPAKMRHGLARPAKLLRAKIPNPPRIRADPLVCGPARVLFLKIKYLFILHFVLKKLSD